MECIVLAGGLGTRLRGTIGDYPKCMALVNGKPFLQYIFQYLEQQHCSRVILSLGYKHELITEWLQNEKWPFKIDYVIEYEPLGTGGGIQLALKEAKSQHVLILNGDTMFRLDLDKIMDFHLRQKAAATLGLKKMYDFDRYGLVNIDSFNTITSFEEKKKRDAGLINGGVYVVDKDHVFGKHLPEKFSFEKDYFEAFVNEKKFCGFMSDAYFIDIGIPEDYQRSQEDFKLLFK